MVWKEGKKPNWGVSANGFGGQPTGAVRKGVIVFSVRGPRTDAQPCMTALAFIPPAPGVFRIAGTLDVDRWEGTNSVAFHILRRDLAKGTVAMVKDVQPEPAAGNAIAAEARLAAGEELLLVASVNGFNTAATMTLKDLKISGP